MDNDPRAPLVRLAESGGFLAAFLASLMVAISWSDGWIPGDDYDPRERDWYQAAVAQDDTILSLPYVDANSNQLVVTFATPVKRKRRLTGSSAVM